MRTASWQQSDGQLPLFSAPLQTLSPQEHSTLPQTDRTSPTQMPSQKLLQQYESTAQIASTHGSHPGWRGGPATHLFGCVPAQAPPVHWSPDVQLVPSSHGVPSGLLGYEQVKPIGGGISMQAPGPWHWPGGGQMKGLPPTQAPF